jgi:hypothetical protein
MVGWVYICFHDSVIVHLFIQILNRQRVKFVWGLDAGGNRSCWKNKGQYGWYTESGVSGAGYGCEKYSSLWLIFMENPLVIHLIWWSSGGCQILVWSCKQKIWMRRRVPSKAKVLLRRKYTIKVDCRLSRAAQKRSVCLFIWLRQLEGGAWGCP